LNPFVLASDEHVCWVAKIWTKVSSR